MTENPTSFLKLMTKADVAAVFGVCTKTVDAYVRSGLLPAPKAFGAREYWHPELFAQFLRQAFGEQQPTVPTESASVDVEGQHPPLPPKARTRSEGRATPLQRQRQRQEELLRTLNAVG